jgi:predicted  nucleic acid-binding Zn-ribbon protein
MNIRATLDRVKKVEYPKDVKALQEMLAAANKEVSRLSHAVTLQAAQIATMQREVEKWERRFDRLLELR